jgi:REP element-mobilizing transposase RayT
MPQSLARILVHLVFSTKNREPFLSPDLRAELHPYLTAALGQSGCIPIEVGGVEDHVHLLFALSRTLTVAQLVESLKTSSSKWIKTRRTSMVNFYWQAGYGAFSVAQSNLKAAARYIQNQEQHHQQETFQDELRRILRKYQMSFDEAYIWD